MPVLWALGVAWGTQGGVWGGPFNELGVGPLLKGGPGSIWSGPGTHAQTPLNGRRVIVAMVGVDCLRGGPPQGPVGVFFHLFLSCMILKM